MMMIYTVAEGCTHNATVVENKKINRVSCVILSYQSYKKTIKVLLLISAVKDNCISYVNICLCEIVGAFWV